MNAFAIDPQKRVWNYKDRILVRDGLSPDGKRFSWWTIAKWISMAVGRYKLPESQKLAGVDLVRGDGPRPATVLFHTHFDLERVEHVRALLRGRACFVSPILRSPLDPTLFACTTEALLFTTDDGPFAILAHLGVMGSLQLPKAHEIPHFEESAVQ